MLRGPFFRGHSVYLLQLRQILATFGIILRDDALCNWHHNTHLLD